MSNPYTEFSETHFWSTGVKNQIERSINIEVDSLLKVIKKNSVISSAGSCFAQHIGKNLLSRNFKFLKSQYSDDRVESFGIGNIYTTRQLRQWLEFCLDRMQFSKETIFEDEDTMYYDYLIPHMPAKSSLLELQARRQDLGKELRKYLTQSDVFIFTCGLTEQWETPSHEALAVCPGTICGKFDSKKHRFYNLTYNDILDDLTEIDKLISEINANIKFIYTVSPVPLTATAAKDHVLVASNNAKSKLKAAVCQHVESSQSSVYFPSYELITHNTKSDWRFSANLRTVSKLGVDFVMQHAFEEARKVQGSFYKNRDQVEQDNVYCEEEKLETLKRVRLQPSHESEIFLIGDSHMGKLGKGFSELNMSFHGGAIMNGGAFAEMQFQLNDDCIFLPTNSKVSSEIWQETFKKLKEVSGKAIIFTNIGFQTHLNIWNVANSANSECITIQNIADYFSEKLTGVLEVLVRLERLGHLYFVEDPNFYTLTNATSTINSTLSERVMRVNSINFNIYSQYMRNVASHLKADYSSLFNEVLQDIIVETSDVTRTYGEDIVHGSELYYKKLAQKLSLLEV